MKKLYVLSFVLLWMFFLTWCNQNGWAISDKQEDVTIINQESLDEGESFNATMMEVFKKGKTVTCEFSMDMDGTPAKWIFYVEGKKMRYSTNASSQGVEMEVDVIVKDWFSYSWSNLQPNEWFKMKEADDEDKYEDVGAEERDQKVNFTCKKGVPSGIFDLPKGIKFQEFNYDNSDI